MQAYLAEGLSAAEAAAAALDGGPGTQPREAAWPAAGSEPFAELRRALEAFDEPAAQAELDQLIAELSLPAVLREVILPYLADLGQRWQRGTAGIAAEHFASNLIRDRLAGLARGWGRGHGPQALLPCPPGELHDIPLMIFGIALNRNGWRIGYPGPGTPVGELARTAATSHADLVVLAATVPQTPRTAATRPHLTGPACPARPRRSQRHTRARPRGGSPADGGRPGNRSRADQMAAVKSLTRVHQDGRDTGQPGPSNLHRRRLRGRRCPEAHQRLLHDRRVAACEVLAEPFGGPARQHHQTLAVISHAASFGTWHSLCAEHGLSDREAVEAMTGMILAITASPRHGSPTRHAAHRSHR
jgi:B12 binding domain